MILQAIIIFANSIEYDKWDMHRIMHSALYEFREPFSGKLNVVVF